MVLPVRFAPSMEQFEEDEARTIAELHGTWLEISKTTCMDEKEALWAVPRRRMRF